MNLTGVCMKGRHPWFSKTIEAVVLPEDRTYADVLRYDQISSFDYNRQVRVDVHREYVAALMRFLASRELTDKVREHGHYAAEK
jgi:hypothetical protein